MKKHKETGITITHNIAVDGCIADEIKKLNNEEDITTLSSCCGHGESGYIIVMDKDIQKMVSIGYELTSMKYLDYDILGDRVTICAFKPKSKCFCNGNCEMCYPHPAHEPGKCEYCDCGR